MERTKVLIVEDDKLLSTTLHLFVEELGYELIGISEDGQSAIEKVKDNSPDIVLMDIHLPGETDGISAAKTIFEDYNVPIIYVTSDNNQETVRRALATNSFGYLIKPVSKVMLGITIEQALLKQQHEKEISDRENRYRTLVEDSPDAVVVVDQDSKIKYINFTGLKLFGTIHIEEVLDKSIYDFFPDEASDILEKKIQIAFESKERIDYFPLEFRSLKGKELLVGVVGSVIDFNKNISTQLIISDHTEKVRSRNIIEEQQSIINTINDGIVALDKNGKVTLWNKGAEKIFGIEGKNALNQDISFVFDELSDFFEKRFFKPVLKTGRYEFEYKSINKMTNLPVHTRMSLSSMKSRNELTGVICYCYDITNRMDHELQLKRFNADYRAIFNGGSEAMIIISNEFFIVDYNKMAKQYADNHIKKEISVSGSILDFMYFLNRSEIRNLLENAFEGVAHYLERLVTFNGIPKYLKINIFPVFNDDDSIDRLCISLLDITERKKIEKALDETRNELKPMFDSSIQRFYLVDLSYNLLAFNKSAQDTIQRDFNHNLRRGDYIVDFIPPEMSPDEFKEYFEQAKKGNLVVFKQKLKVNGGYEFNEAHLEPIINDKGEIYRILLWTLDVTESEQNLIALKESEERYALVAKGGNDGLWDWDMIKDEVYLSPRWKSVLGYDEDEFISRDDARDLFIHPEDLEWTKYNLKQHLKGETEVYLNEYRLRHKDGSYRWILERGLALRDGETGKPYRMAGTITDITERKKSVEELSKVNQALLEERRMFIKGNVVVFRVNANDFYDIRYMSENVGDVLGYSVDDFKSAKVDFSSIVYKDDRELHKLERDKALKENATHVEFSVYRIVKKNGEIIYVKDFITIIRNDNDEPIEFLGYFINVTKEKQAEITIRENQKKYFTLFSEANDAILMIENERIVDCNAKTEELFGYKRSELLDIEVLKLSPEKQPSGTPSYEKRQRKIKEAFEGKSSTFYWQYIRSSGDVFDAEVSLSVVELNDTKYLHAIIRDITERKRIEKELTLQREMYESLMDAMPDMIFIMNREGKYMHYKPDKLTGLEVSEEKIVGKNLSDFFEGEKKNEFQQKIENVLDNSIIETIRYNLDSPKGIRNFEGRITKLNEEQVFVQVRDFTNSEL